MISFTVVSTRASLIGVYDFQRQAWLNASLRCNDNGQFWNALGMSSLCGIWRVRLVDLIKMTSTSLTASFGTSKKHSLDRMV